MTDDDEVGAVAGLAQVRRCVGFDARCLKGTASCQSQKLAIAGSRSSDTRSVPVFRLVDRHSEFLNAAFVSDIEYANVFRREVTELERAAC